MKTSSRISCLALLSLVGWIVPCRAAAPTRLLWHIGTPGHGDAGFALAPNGWQQYAQSPPYTTGSNNAPTNLGTIKPHYGNHDPFYVVGFSKPSAWPYVLPGPADLWAGVHGPYWDWSGGFSHVGTIAFQLSAVAPEGHASLVIHLVDTATHNPPLVSVGIDGHHVEKRMPSGGGGASLNGNLSTAKAYVWRIHFPTGWLKAGNNLVTIRTVKGSWMIFGAIQLSAPSGTTLQAPTAPAMLSAHWDNVALARSRSGHAVQALRLHLFFGKSDRSLQVRIGNSAPITIHGAAGIHSLRVTVPPAQRTGAPVIEMIVDGNIVSSLAAVRQPVPHRTIYVLPHSHVDIGYLFYQPVAIHAHHVYIKNALKLIKQTAPLVAASRFKWNIESMIEVDGYLRGFEKGSPTVMANFVDAVRAGEVGLDGTYCNELTGLCRPQELISWLHYGHELRVRYGLKINSAMLCDVPGVTWGAVPVLADAGIKYFLWGPNRITHVGFENNFNGRAFNWLSPSRVQKIMVWQNANSNYCSPWFTVADVRPWLHWFTAANPDFPYQVMYVMEGCDSAPPPNYAVPLLNLWNKTHVWPRLVFSTVDQALRKFVAKYGQTIPSFRGDYNGYWEDGAASTPRVNALDRSATEKIAQSQMLWNLLDAAQYPHKVFNNAWQDALMYDEHTWGAPDSWAHPRSKFVTEQWAWKKRYATRAMFQARWLKAQAVRKITDCQPTSTIAVFNTCSWPRTGLVTISAKETGAGDLVRNESGQPVPSQRLANGALVFMAKDIPAMASRTFTISAGTAVPPARAVSVNASGTKFTTGSMAVAISPATGAVVQWSVAGLSPNFVHSHNKVCRGLNDYLYVLGPSNKKVQYSGTPNITVINRGPLVASVRIVSSAPGCKILTRTIEVVAGEHRINFTDSLNMVSAYPQEEAVHIGFGLNVPGETIRFDTPWAVVNPRKDLIPNSNNNIFPVCRWVDESGKNLGITLATPDVPMLEIGRITAPRMNTTHWLAHPAHGGALYSQVYNNYWQTNYKAWEKGPMQFRYSLWAHQAYHQVAAEHFGIDAGQPLIAVSVGKDFRNVSFPLRWDNPHVILAGCHPLSGGAGYLVRLFNVSRKQQSVALSWDGSNKIRVEKCHLFGGHRKHQNRRFTIASMDFVNLVIELNRGR
ncbi:MAG: polysaccharide lyase family protein [Phycisphaerae bacterium]